MQIYQNSDGVDCVLITNDDGSSWSGLKSVYDAQQANSTPSVAPVVTPADPVAATAAVVTPIP